MNEECVKKNIFNNSLYERTFNSFIPKCDIESLENLYKREEIKTLKEGFLKFIKDCINKRRTSNENNVFNSNFIMPVFKVDIRENTLYFMFTTVLIDKLSKRNQLDINDKRYREYFKKENKIDTYVLCTMANNYNFHISGIFFASKANPNLDCYVSIKSNYVLDCLTLEPISFLKSMNSMKVATYMDIEKVKMSLYNNKSRIRKSLMRDFNYFADLVNKHIRQTKYCVKKIEY